MRTPTARRFDAVMALLAQSDHDAVSPFDQEVAAILGLVPLDDLAVWLSTAAMTGVRLGEASVEAICARMRDVAHASRCGWLADLAAVAGTPEALVALGSTFEVTDDVCYELVRHPCANISVLALLPAHEVANLAALGFYRSASGLHSTRTLFAQDADKWAGAEVAPVLLAGELRHGFSWRREHLPWNFETSLDVIAALVEKWGRDHVTLAAHLCTRAGWGSLNAPYGESLPSACCVLASRLGPGRTATATLALALAEDLPLSRALQVAQAVWS